MDRLLERERERESAAMEVYLISQTVELFSTSAVPGINNIVINNFSIHPVLKGLIDILQVSWNTFIVSAAGNLPSNSSVKVG